MELTFLGTGEAGIFDTARGNYSCLIEDRGKSVMVDCGYKAGYSLGAHLVRKRQSILEVPNSLLFTHLHGDHFAGTSALILAIGDGITLYNEQNGSKKERHLTVASAHEDVKERLVRRMSEDYPGLLEHFSEQGLKVEYKVLNQYSPLEGMRINFAQTAHSVPNYAYRLFSEGDGKSLAISGDGALTEGSKALFQGVNLLVHEGFFLNKSSKTHASIEEVVQFAVTAQIPKVTIVHVNQAERNRGAKIGYLDTLIYDAKICGVDLFFPNDGDKITV